MANPTGLVTDQLQTRSVQIDTNLTDKEYYFVTFDLTDDNVVNLAADGALPTFVLLEGKDGSSGGTKTGTVALSGVTKLKINATISAGQYLKSDANGKGVLATTGTNSGAVALESGVAGDLITVQAGQCVVP